ncbi:MAG: amidohydrolase family protein [Phycisphaerales bacterium]
MKEPQAGDFWKDALERWNRLPSEEGVPLVVWSAQSASPLQRYGRMYTQLERADGIWNVRDVCFEAFGTAPSDALEIDLPTKVLLPGFVNAHTHLDLTHIGPRDYDPSDPRGFASWIEMVRRERATDGEAIRASVREGIEKSLRGGVVAVGDIAGAMHTEPVEELRASPLAGVSFVEFFGLGERQQAAIDAMRALVARVPVDADGVKLGLQPHALYSAGPEVFREAGALQRSHGVALSTHLAESIEERRIIVNGDGPIRDFLASMGIPWNEPRAPSPVECFASRTNGEKWLVAHANLLSDDDLELLRLMDVRIAFCPRGHAYFGHARTLGAHRWRDSFDAEIRLSIGTDSVINLPRQQADRISPLDDVRALYREHRTGDPEHDMHFANDLMALVTHNGAEAIGMSFRNFGTWGNDHPVLGLVTVEVGEIGDRSCSVAVLESDAPPELVALSDKRTMARKDLLRSRDTSR